MERHTANRLAATAACTALALTVLAGCHSSSSTAASPPNPGSTARTGTTTPPAAAGGGSCSSVTSADVAGIFTGPISDGVAGTDGSGPGSKDCFYALQGSSSNGFHLSTSVDLTLAKAQYTTVTPISGAADQAWYANNGLVVMVQKGSETCLDNAEFDDPSQVTIKVDSGGAVDPAQLGPFTQKLAALCVKALG